MLQSDKLSQYYYKGAEKRERGILLKYPSANTPHALLGEFKLR